MDILSIDILQIFALLVGIIVLLRVIYIFIYPLFCYSSVRIFNSNNDENIIIVYPKNIPVVNVDCFLTQEQSSNNIPIARIV